MSQSFPALRGAALALIAMSAPAVQAADAPELYHQYCSVCHGDHGDGRSRARQGLSTPPRDFTAPGMSEALTRDYMVNVVLNGKPGTAMVGWKTRLSKTQAEGVVDYIRQNFMHGRGGTVKDPHAAHGTPGQSAPAVAPQVVAQKAPLAGRAAKGAPLYNANCSTCHGLTGEGNGPRAYFIFPKPRNFTADDARARFNPDSLFFAVKHGVQGREMPAWGTVFNDQQIADVSQYVYESFIRPQ